MDTCDVKSIIPGMIWPGFPSQEGAKLFALQFQLEKSQWFSPEHLHDSQDQQLYQCLHHSSKTVPYYRSLFLKEKIKVTSTNIRQIWHDIPILRRKDIQENEKNLISHKIPASHGRPTKIQTSGSTGRPITTLSTGITSFMLLNFTLRDHLWHKRDVSKLFAAIRPEGKLEPGKGVVRKGWGPATDNLFATGPSAALSSRTDIKGQVEWLQKLNPSYLLSLPTNIAALAEVFLSENQVLPNLEEVRTYGEIVSQNVRDLCRQAWNVPVVDMYTTQEVGYIALQCPEQEHYHVQAENLLVEILDDNGNPVSSGETGRVVVTTLHNFAMPLIRYEIGDFAELGEPCSCGRGLPVLKKILGRKRNMLVLPDGRQHWPSFPAEIWQDFNVIEQFQLVQTAKEKITVRLVADSRLDKAEEKTLISVLQERFGYPFMIDFDYREKIDRSKSGKFEDFISEVNV